MSFILEALKKSEQQRQEKNSSSQKVRNRSISLQSHRSDNRLVYWIVTGFLTLVLLGCWWFFSKTEPLSERLPAVEQATGTLTHNLTGESQKTGVTSPAMANTPQKSAVPVEPAPVPNTYVSAPEVSSSRAPAREDKPSIESQRVAISAATETMETDEQVATVMMRQPQSFNKIPLYRDLSGELLNRMPSISLSMHFYNKNPDRRLVRINAQLLHEGDWLDRDLQLIEITVTGAIMDFLGKSFEIRSARR